jgi:hypothetical protein
VRLQHATGANFDVFADYAIRTDLGRPRDDRAGMNDRGRMDHGCSTVASAPYIF